MPTTEELLQKNSQVGTTANADTTGATTPTGNGTGLADYSQNRIGAVNQMYDAQRAAREAELKSAHDQSMSALQAAQDKIAPQYQQQANLLAQQQAQQRQNFFRQAAATGLNTGVSAQESLAREGAYQGAMGRLRTAEADAQAAIERQRADLQASYQSQVAAALAENDYNRAGALLNEYNNEQQRSERAAETLANYGDFSGYASLFGDEQANAMFQLWVAANPDLAYNTGRITRDQYRVMTGQDPVGWTATGGVTVSDLVDGRIPAGVGNQGGGGGTGSYLNVTGRPGPTRGYEYVGIYSDPNTKF